ncbi:MAG TPA: SufE family protein [Prosthecobacter sp.]
MSLEEKQRTLIEDLNLIPDPQERLSALGSGAGRVKIAEEHKVDANLVPGCVSRVWLHGEMAEGRTQFRCDADSPIVRSLAALLCDLYSGVAPAEAATVEPMVWHACGFTKLLSPTRLNGLANVRNRIRAMAQGWSGAEAA